PDAAMQEVREAAKKAYIDDFIMQLPKGYETSAGVKGANFSMGQRQRILIARAILRNNPIFVLDEATSALDAETERLITNSLNSVMQNKTVIGIAHKISTLSMMDRVVVLQDGKIVAIGKH
ncbi:MAG: hypothetical protein CUN55_20455, partial [Phototrophicales bacterium]